MEPALQAGRNGGRKQFYERVSVENGFKSYNIANFDGLATTLNEEFSDYDISNMPFYSKAFCRRVCIFRSLCAPADRRKYHSLQLQ